MGTAWIGKYGALERVWFAKGETRRVVRNNAVRDLPYGGRMVFEAQRAIREWDVEGDLLFPGEQAIWERYAYRTVMPPFVWISAWAAATNLMMPQDSLLTPGSVTSAGIPSSAPVVLDDGTTAYGSVTTVADNAVVGVGYQPSLGRYRAIPIARDVPVTASAWVGSGGTAYMDVWWDDAAGNEVKGTRVRASAKPGVAVRRIVAEGMEPPTGAVSMHLVFVNARVIAQPSVTLTPEVRPWGIGDGCYSAYVVDHSMSPRLWTQKGFASGASFKVIELEV